MGNMTVFRLGVSNCFAVKRWPMPRNWAEICSKELALNLVQFSFDVPDPRTIEPAISERHLEKVLAENLQYLSHLAASEGSECGYGSPCLFFVNRLAR